MGKHEDKVFMKRFSAIIGALVGVTIVILIIALGHEPVEDPTRNPSKIALAAERVAPMGAVRTELPSGEELAQVPATEPMTVAAAPDGAATYASACQACHMAGAAGAPIPGSDLWAERAAKGAETLYTHAINGFNAMPAKGGRMDLSDEEVMAAVDHMLAQ
jgi:cytochrome c5